MEIKIYDNAEEIGKEVGSEFVKAVNAKPGIVLGLATGASPIPTYKYICEQYKNGLVSLENVKTFNLDEYVALPKNDKNSYYTFMHVQFFNNTDIKEENVHFLNGNADDVDEECRAYDKLIKNAGGIDIQLLGVGRNGHIGFNEPSNHFTKGSFKVKLTESTIEANKRFFEKEEDVPRQAYTMGIGTIMRAKKILLVASGEGKADINAKAFTGPITPEVPASILQLHNDVTIVADAAALSKINM